MAPVVEFRRETLESGKRFDVGRRVTDVADRIRIPLCELLRMTRRARYVSRHSDLCAVVAPHVADETRHPCVLRRVVTKLRKVLRRFGRRLDDRHRRTRTGVT